jgi:hypothetical protein
MAPEQGSSHRTNLQLHKQNSKDKTGEEKKHPMAEVHQAKAPETRAGPKDFKTAEEAVHKS